MNVENTELNNKTRVYKALIILATVLVVLLGLSYAYFTQSGSNEAGTIGGGAITTFDINLVTPNNGYINAEDLLPILSTEVNELAEVGTFSVVTGNNDKTVTYSISLIDLNISANLRVPAFRWQLINLEDSSRNRSGTFNGVSASNMLVIDNISIPANTTHNYEFRIWIETDGFTPQNQLMNGSFGGRFSIISTLVHE